MSSFMLPDPSAATPEPAMVDTSKPTPPAETLTGAMLAPVVVSGFTFSAPCTPPPSRPSPAAEVEILKLSLPSSSNPVPAKLAGSIARFPAPSSYKPLPVKSKTLTDRSPEEI